jgi:phytoene dehydrogenase-like protein
MILYEGKYSGILQPWRHYIPLRKDHSNMAEVVSALRDAKRCEEIADQAYREVARGERYSYKTFAEKVDRAMAEAFRPEMARVGASLDQEDVNAILRRWRTTHEWRQLIALWIGTIAYLSTIRILFCWASPELRHRLYLRCQRFYRSCKQSVRSRFQKLAARDA